MPTYEYECDACNHRFELFQSIMADPEKKCPECKKLKLRRLMGTGAAVVFKGSGFYQTDYRSESYKKSAEADSKSTSTDSKTEPAKTSSSEGNNKADSTATTSKSSETKSSSASELKSASEPKSKNNRKKEG